jgi:hypothetical protein
VTLENFLSTSGLTKTQPRLIRKIVNRNNRNVVNKNRTTGAKKLKITSVADFETTTDELDCRVWSWGLVEVENPNYDKVEIGTDIASFIMRIMKHNNTCYFHNLKFDGYFILDYLLKNGYSYVFTDFVKRPATFKTLINDMGQFYSISVKWPNGNICEFRDSFKKLPFSVKRIAEDWGFEDSKGTLDYDAHNGPITPITPQEEDYLRRDVTIVAQALKILYDQKHTKLTSGSDALAEYKSIVGNDWFKRMFPTFSLAMDAEIRRAYRGGYTYRDPRFKGMNCNRGLVLDVNSLYPSVMMNNILPYGEPDFVKGECKPTASRPLTIFSVTFTAKLKKDHLPCIQIKGHSLFSSTEYLSDIPDPVTLMVTNIDWILYQEHYDISILEYGGGWRFHATTGLFTDYINKWSKIKAESKGAKRELAKLFLNALYGKFASNPNVTGKFPRLIDDAVKLIRGEEEMRAPVYTAIGVFVTSWARDLTIRAAQNNYKSFAYADTDSLHLFVNEAPDSLEIHPTKLGAWKLEYKFVSAYFVRAKFYMELTDKGEFVTHIAGVPAIVSENMTFDDLVNNKILKGKLNPKIVSGGVVLKEIDFTVTL